jgi:hypothetical protein
MHNSRRSPRFSARLNLESLESRTLLSTTLPTPPAAPVGHQSTTSSIQVLHQHTHAQPVYAKYSYNWGLGHTGAVILGTNSSTLNGKSTGSVDFAVVRHGMDVSRVGGPATAVPLGFVITMSSADPSKPDHYHSAFTVTLTLRDAAAGATGKVTFKGTINGTLNWNVSNLTLTFQSPTTQRLTLGKNIYTITMPQAIHPGGPNDMPSPVYARVQVTSRPTIHQL